MTADPTTSSENRQPTASQAMAAIMPSQRAQINEVMSLITKLSIESKTAMLETIVNDHHHARKPNRCHLLAIPAEIRVKIFELSLQEDDIVEVNGRAQHLPGLLTTCVHIRREALSIYYSINRFRLCVQDYDVNPVIPFCTSYRKHYIPLKNVDQSNPQRGIQVLQASGTPNWQNLLDWLHAEWVGEMPWSWLMDPAILNPNSVAVFNVFLASVRMRITGMTWESAKSCLEPVLFNLKLVDPRWQEPARKASGV
ncbi:hypothetical protein LTR56_005395 [Elasticomyces elasticus]|nr:hypothetical protein LTR22_020626 [Elasticomyces elasticus]KAK3651887.1 hypothetical protein LTR56_005395 [Elasticomyces elasticus]KAK4927782.1 hypothetical protein LTR49_005407 [Elasticomyces elasticus]KAK5761453.1 hypothetical protein LTS12_008415 [Elasticomyces elasticus]